MSEQQPTEAQELANAAYVYRKHVQAEVINAMRDIGITIDKAEWWFERFIAAYRREIEAERIAKAGTVEDKAKDQAEDSDFASAIEESIKAGARQAKHRFRLSSSEGMTTIEIGDADEATKP